MRDWLSKQWQDIRGNFKFWILGILGWIVVNIAIALIHGLALWQQIVLGALFTFMLAWGLIATVQANRPKSGAVIVTPENVESYVRQWLDNFNVSLQKLPKSEKLHFDYKVAFVDRAHLHIGHPKERSHYLRILAHFALPKRYKDLFDKLSEPEKKRFVLGTRTEIYRARINCSCKTFFDKIVITKLLPIATLTEGDVIEQLNAVHASQSLVIDTINLGLGLEQEGEPAIETESTSHES